MHHRVHVRRIGRSRGADHQPRLAVRVPALAHETDRGREVDVAGHRLRGEVEGVGRAPDVAAAAGQAVLVPRAVEHGRARELHVADLGVVLESAECRRADRLELRCAEQHAGETLVDGARPADDAEAALVVPGRPADAVFLQHGAEIGVPAQAVGARRWTAGRPTRRSRAAGPSPARARPAWRSPPPARCGRSSGSCRSRRAGRGQPREIRLCHHLARVAHRPLVLAHLRPAGAVMRERHRRVEVEAQQDLGIARGNAQGVEGAGALPPVRADHDRSPRLALTDHLHRPRQQAVPDLGVVRHRLVHHLVGDLVVRTPGEPRRELAPDVQEALLRCGLAPQRLRALVEVVRAQDVEVDDHPEPVRCAPVERRVEQRESLGLRLAGLVPELLLVDRQAQVVEAELRHELHVLGGEPALPFLAPARALRQPVRDVGPVLHDEAVRRAGRERRDRGCRRRGGGLRGRLAQRRPSGEEERDQGRKGHEGNER